MCNAFWKMILDSNASMNVSYVIKQLYQDDWLSVHRQVIYEQISCVLKLKDTIHKLEISDCFVFFIASMFLDVAEMSL